ncbi:Uncharacterised protein [Mycobacteroides abscessus subsp. abscessus]|nr:Uncharacterised protein [Mycobacteroides abscessus subsp. abscessus]
MTVTDLAPAADQEQMAFPVAAPATNEPRPLSVKLT